MVTLKSGQGRAGTSWLLVVWGFKLTGYAAFSLGMKRHPFHHLIGSDSISIERPASPGPIGQSVEAKYALFI
ncbi:MAG: hypothetical protein AAF591_22925 [Verrucomicrobiota bacterium]